MKRIITTSLLLTLCSTLFFAQDLTQGLRVNDLEIYPMQDIEKPPYLGSYIDPSFGTTIRRISDAGVGGVIKPMYSTIQAWNADESLMILYDQRTGDHQLLDGMNYTFIRNLNVAPDDIEQIFWDFNDPDVFYFPQSNNDFIRYTVSTQTSEVIVNLDDIVTNCSGNISLGNDVQMMSWNSDIISFRCNNERAYYYRISTGEVTELNVADVSFVAPMPGPSGNLLFHDASVYGLDGNFLRDLNVASGEHASLGQLANGNDAYFAIAFAQGPDGGCIGDIIAHDLTTGECFPVISQSQGYEYPQSGTHMSALAHRNSDGGWIAASMMGYDLDGQSLLDQELVIARADQGNIQVARIGHHRSDENEFDYWGEPHATISPTGTRVLFGSDWSGAEDGQSVDAYVVELPAFSVVLPVELSDFRVETKDCGVQLNWTTSSETNNDFFEVERSKDGILFESVGKVLGAGNSIKEINYYFEDKPGSSVFFYRLKQVDQDGKTTYSKVLQVNSICGKIVSTLTPNPTRTSSVLNFNSTVEGEALVHVYDLAGKVIQATEIAVQEGEEVQLTLEFNTLAPGTYLVELRLGNEKKVHKLMKY